jgi:RNA recognition motif-containing protein
MGDSRDNEGRKVFVGGIPFGVDQNGVREDFGRYGEIEDVYLPTDRATGKLRGFGFITFRDPRDAEEASRVMHG